MEQRALCTATPGCSICESWRGLCAPGDLNLGPEEGFPFDAPPPPPPLVFGGPLGFAEPPLGLLGGAALAPPPPLPLAALRNAPGQPSSQAVHFTWPQNKSCSPQSLATQAMFEPVVWPNNTTTELIAHRTTKADRRARVVGPVTRMAGCVPAK